MSYFDDGRSECSVGLDCEFLLVKELQCHRCDGDLICSVRAPHSFLREDGSEVVGYRTVALCPECDKANPSARAVIECCRGAVHGQLSAAAAHLLGDWLREVLPTQIEVDELMVLQGGPR